MSFSAFKWAMKQRSGNPTNMAVLAKLADHADDKGECFPSQETLAEECQCTRKTVRTAMQQLEKAGLIRRTRRWKKDGHRTSDGIVLCLEVKSTPRDESLGVKLDVPMGKDYPASILNQSLNQKEEILIWKWTETDGPLLNRISQTDLWAAAERELGVKAPIYCNKLYFPQQAVDAAIAKMKSKPQKAVAR